MDTNEMQEVLNNYRRILGYGCTNCISKSNIDVLERVTGRIGYESHLGFLLNIIDYIEEKRNYMLKNTGVKKTSGDENDDMIITLFMTWRKEMELENDKLKVINKNLTEKIKSLEQLIDTYNKCYLQRANLKIGKKIAYKGQASLEEIIKLKNEGLSNEQIAKKLEVSKSTVWRRLRDTN